MNMINDNEDEGLEIQEAIVSKARESMNIKTLGSRKSIVISRDEGPPVANPFRLTFRRLKDMPLWLPNPWVRRGAKVDDDYHDTYENVIAYHLTWYQRMFVIMEYPNSCQAARIYQYMNMIVISLCVLMAYVSSTKAYQTIPTTCDDPACKNEPSICENRTVCAPIPWELFQIVDFICCILYGFDLIARLSIAPLMSSRILRIVPKHWDEIEHKKILADQLEEPTWGPFQKLLRYWILPGNIVDTMSTLPYFIIIAIVQSNSATWRAPWVFSTHNTAILTVRIARCFRLLKVLDVHPQGSPKLSIIITTVRESFSSLLIMLGFVLISAIIFGSLIYTCERGDFIVTAEYPDGIYLRKDVVGEGFETTPFDNLGACVYWAIVTMTTLGYGDLYPTSNLGRFIGAACSIYGVIVISLPVTIINNAFTSQMETFAAGVEREKHRLESMNKLKAKGLLGSIVDMMAPKSAALLKEKQRRAGATEVVEVIHDKEIANIEIVDDDSTFNHANAIKVSQVHLEQDINAGIMHHLHISENQRSRKENFEENGNVVFGGSSKSNMSSKSNASTRVATKFRASFTSTIGKMKSSNSPNKTDTSVHEVLNQYGDTESISTSEIDLLNDDNDSKNSSDIEEAILDIAGAEAGIELNNEKDTTSDGHYTQEELLRISKQIVIAKKAILALEHSLYKHQSF